jgi:hypothetical protein
MGQPQSSTDKWLCCECGLPWSAFTWDRRHACLDHADRCDFCGCLCPQYNRPRGRICWTCEELRPYMDTLC